MTAPLTCLAESSWDTRGIAWSNRKHDTTSMVNTSVGPYGKNLINVGDCRNNAKVDVFDSFLLDEIFSEPVSINDTFAIVFKE